MIDFLKNSDSWIACQQTLIYCALESASATEFLPSLAGDQYGKSTELWENAVREFIFCSIKGGYIEVFEDYGIANNFTAEALYELYKCPSLGNEDVWMGIQFNATPKLIKILQENNLLAWEKMHSIEENENLKRMFLSDCKP